jgi:hypothetical protein
VRRKCGMWGDEVEPDTKPRWFDIKCGVPHLSTSRGQGVYELGRVYFLYGVTGASMKPCYPCTKCPNVNVTKLLEYLRIDGEAISSWSESSGLDLTKRQERKPASKKVLYPSQVHLLVALKTRKVIWGGKVCDLERRQEETVTYYARGYEHSKRISLRCTQSTRHYTKRFKLCGDKVSLTRRRR